MDHLNNHALEPLHILVTGATGFIGARLVNALRQRGHKLTALTRDRRRCRQLFGLEVEALDWSTDFTSQAFDAVVNLAGARIAPLPWTTGRRKQLRHSRVANTETLVKSLTNSMNPPKVWVQASAVGYYGMEPTNELMSEANPAGQDFPAKLCLDWETAAAPIQSCGTRLCILRLGLVLGAGGALPGLLLPIRMAFGGPLGTGMQPFPWIHIDDVVRLILACLEGDRWHGAYNAVAPERHTQSSFARCAAHLLNRPYWFPAPAFPLRLLGEVSQLFLDGRQVVPKRLLEQSWDWTYPELKPALASLIATTASSKPISEQQ